MQLPNKCTLGHKSCSAATWVLLSFALVMALAVCNNTEFGSWREELRSHKEYLYFPGHNHPHIPSS